MADKLEGFFMRSYIEARNTLFVTGLLVFLAMVLVSCGPDRSCDGGSCVYAEAGSVVGDGTIADGSDNSDNSNDSHDDNSPPAPVINQPVIVP